MVTCATKSRPRHGARGAAMQEPVRVLVSGSLIDEETLLKSRAHLDAGQAAHAQLQTDRRRHHGMRLQHSLKQRH